MLPFLLLVLLISLAVFLWTVLRVFLPFCPAFSGVWVIIANAPVLCLLLALFSLCLRFLLPVCCCSFCCCKKTALTCVSRYRVPCPLGLSHTVFLCSPLPYYPTRSMQTIRGHACTSGIVCVLLLCVCSLVWPYVICEQVVCRCVCRRVWCANVCARGAVR